MLWCVYAVKRLMCDWPVSVFVIVFNSSWRSLIDPDIAAVYDTHSAQSTEERGINQTQQTL